MIWFKQVKGHTENADGAQISAGIVARVLKWLGADITLTGSGSATYTFPGATDTIVGINATQTLAAKTLSAPIIGAGSATAGSKMKRTSGTVLTTAEAGADEYDGVALYQTNDTTSGRGINIVRQRFRLTAAGSNISTIANFFGTTSNISLVANAEYEIEIECWYLKTTAGTVTFTFTNSAVPSSMNIHYELSAATGIVTTAAATYLFGDQYGITSATPTVVQTNTTSAVMYRAYFKISLINGTGTSLKIQATASAGTLTPGINSNWRVRRMPLANVGNFAA